MTTQQTRFAVTGNDTPNGVHVAVLTGQLDAHTAPELERYLENIVRTENRSKVILDFSTLEYISSAGLGVLMGFIEETREDGGDIKLAAVPEKIYHVLDLLGFPMIFTILPTVSKAEEAFSRG